MQVYKQSNFMQVLDADNFLQVLDAAYFSASKVNKVPVIISIKKKDRKVYMQAN